MKFSTVTCVSMQTAVTLSSKVLKTLRVDQSLLMCEPVCVTGSTEMSLNASINSEHATTYYRGWMFRKGRAKNSQKKKNIYIYNRVAYSPLRSYSYIGPSTWGRAEKKTGHLWQIQCWWFSPLDMAVTRWAGLYPHSTPGHPPNVLSSVGLTASPYSLTQNRG